MGRSKEKIRTNRYLYRGEVPVSISYYFSKVLHIAFPSMHCGIFSMNPNKPGCVIYLDGAPATFWEGYLLDEVLQFIEKDQVNEHQEIVIRNESQWKMMKLIVKSMIRTGELIPVDDKNFLKRSRTKC